MVFKMGFVESGEVKMGDDDGCWVVGLGWL